MYSLNKIHIIGHLTGNPEVRQIASGTSVCDLNIKIIENVKKSDNENISITSFCVVTVWGKLAEIVGDYCKAGSQVFIGGRAKTENWETPEGEKRYRTKVIAEDLILLDAKNDLGELSGNLDISAGLNSIQIVGNLTRDPELRQTTSGQNVTNFSVATNRSWRDKNSGENKEEAEFHNCVVWEDLAIEVAERIKRGQKVFVRGRLQTRSWESPNGEKKYTTEIIADKVLLLGARSSEFLDSSASSQNQEKPADNASSSNTQSEKIPEINYESEIKPEDLPF